VDEVLAYPIRAVRERRTGTYPCITVSTIEQQLLWIDMLLLSISPFCSKSSPPRWLLLPIVNLQESLLLYCAVAVNDDKYKHVNTGTCKMIKIMSLEVSPMSFELHSSTIETDIICRS
jgi:hypothetical protein